MPVALPASNTFGASYAKLTSSKAATALSVRANVAADTAHEPIESLDLSAKSANPLKMLAGVEGLPFSCGINERGSF